MVVKVIRRFTSILLCLGVCVSNAHSHQLDEYVQATLVEIEPTNIRLSINLTPGVEIVDKVLKRIDIDANGAITELELRSYAELLKRDLSIRLDGNEVDLHVAETFISESSDLKEGWGIIQSQYAFSINSLAAGTHKFSLENRHMRSVSVYLFNAARSESATIQISQQRRSDNQSHGEIDFVYRPVESNSSILVLIWPASIAFFAVGCVVRLLHSRVSWDRP